MACADPTAAPGVMGSEPLDEWMMAVHQLLPALRTQLRHDGVPAIRRRLDRYRARRQNRPASMRWALDHGNRISAFLPIGDYAFLSDCQATSPVAPNGSVERSHTHRRSTTDRDADHAVLRLIGCVQGSVEIKPACEPAFDHGGLAAGWSYGGSGYSEAFARSESMSLELRLVTDLPLGFEGPCARACTKRHAE